MLGLPHSSELKRDVIAELKHALDYSPNHFSVYLLTVKKSYTHFSHLPDEAWVEQEYIKVANFLKDYGFNHYEVSNFALRGKESQHNLNYWKSKTVAALGPSATGFFAEKKMRYKWKVNACVCEIENLSDSEFLLEQIYMGLRSSAGLDLGLLDGDRDILWKCVKRWQEQGWAIVDEGKILYLTSQGYLILDSLLNELFSLKLIK